MQEITKSAEITLETMAAALGLPLNLPAEPQPTRRKATQSNPTPKILVRLSVRNGGGLPRCYRKVVSGISKLEAEIEVKKMARAEGFTVWATLEVSPTEGTVQ